MATYRRLVERAEMGADLTSDKSRQAMLDAYAEDFELVEPPSLPHGGVHRGRDEWIAMHEKMRSLWHQKLTIDHIWEPPGEDMIILYSTMEWTAVATGKTVTFPAIELLHFRDGLICKIEMYLQDTKAILDTLDAD
jgi:hypothetical protein